MRRPTAAERARTMAYGVAGAVLHTPGIAAGAPVPAHVTGETGGPLLLMPAESPVVGSISVQEALAVGDLPAILQVTDVAPVVLPDRVRGRAWLHGRVVEVPAAGLLPAAALLARLHPWSRPYEMTRPGGGRNGPPRTVLALEVSEVEIEDRWGKATVDPEDYAAAAPDPFVAIEPAMLEHLDTCHRAEFAVLVRERFGAAVGSAPVRALGLDRFGLWVRRLPDDRRRAGASADALDLRVEFSAPVGDLPGLRRACRRLFATNAA